MAVNDVYEVIDVQRLFEQEILNVYFYEQRAAFVPLAGSTAQALADEWVETVLPLILAVQATELTHIEVRVRNLFDDTDQGLAVAGVTGTQGAGGDVDSAFVAAGLQLNTDNAAVRPGAKRYAGITANSAPDGVMDSNYIAAMNAIGDALSAPITGGLIITEDIMFPVVVQRVRSGAPGNYTYRLPESSGEATVGLIIEALVKVILTSQISRKIGVGV